MHISLYKCIYIQSQKMSPTAWAVQQQSFKGSGLFGYFQFLPLPVHLWLLAIALRKVKSKGLGLLPGSMVGGGVLLLQHFAAQPTKCSAALCSRAQRAALCTAVHCTTAAEPNVQQLKCTAMCIENQISNKNPGINKNPSSSLFNFGLFADKFV